MSVISVSTRWVNIASLGLFEETDYPSASNVKSGVFYNFSAYEGTLSTSADYPAITDVRDGVDYDNGNLTGTLSTSADYPAITDVRDGVDYDSGNLTGTLVVPSAADVRDGVDYDNGSIGLLDLPAGSDVRINIIYDNGTKVGSLIPYQFGLENAISQGVRWYYPETLRNILVSLSYKFSRMQVYRWDKARTTVVKIINVPLMFAPVEKQHLDRMEDFTSEIESQGQRYFEQLPRLSVTMDAVTYAPDRATGINEYRYFKDDSLDSNIIRSVFKDYEPSPYDLTFTLHIKTDRMNDYVQIIENIIPYFNPKLMLRVKEFSFLNIERDLSVILNSVTPQFSDELDKTGRRQLNGDITFTVEAWFYRPISTAKLVKVIKTKYYVGDVSLSALDKTVSMSAFSTSAEDFIPSGTPTVYDVSGYDANQEAYFFLDQE